MALEDADGDGIGDVCDSTDKIRGLVREYYRDILDREPEPTVLNYWVSEIERVMGLGIDVKEGFQAAARFFFNSQEYLDKGKANTGSASPRFKQLTEALLLKAFYHMPYSNIFCYSVNYFVTVKTWCNRNYLVGTIWCQIWNSEYEFPDSLRFKVAITTKTF